jgi:hypothetical protein
MRSIDKPALAALLVLLSAAPLLSAALEVRTVARAEDLPEAFCPGWSSGDILVSDGRFLALVGGSDRALKTTLNLPTASLKGGIIAFVPAGRNCADALVIGAPALIVKNRNHYLTYGALSARPDPSGRTAALECEASYGDAQGRTAAVRTVYRFVAGSGRIEIVSTLTNTGSAPFEGLGFHVYFNAQSSYSFNPYDRERFPGLNFRVYQKPGRALGWLNLNPVPAGGGRWPGTLAPGASITARYILFADETSEAVLASLYRELKVETATARLFFEDVRSETMEVVVREPVSSSIFYKGFGAPRPGLDVALPPGVYEVTAHFFPAVAKKFLSVAAGAVGECVFKDAPRASVRLKLRDGMGGFVPGKVTVIGVGPTPTPYLAPDDPVASGRGWEGFRNHVFPGKDGAEVELPAGSYLLTASRGPEHTIARETVALLEGERREVILTIDRAFATPGLVSLDPHLHTRLSDGSNTVEDRVRSLAAEGIDVAVATDHNFVNDYRPALAALGLEDEMAVLPGCEVTAPDNYVHFNLYPLEPAPGEDNNGAVSALGGSPEALFKAAGGKPGPVLRQVNHPRAGSLGYFNNYELDKETAGSAAAGFSTDFDVMETMNGPLFDRGNDQAIADWLHLLNRGFYFPAVGSSDTHAIDGEEPGYSRTYVRYAGGEGRALDAPALLEAVRAGRSFVSNGPLVELKVGDRAEPGDTLTARDGRVAVQVEVRGAPWVEVDEVCLIINGEPGLVFPVAPAGGAVRKFRQRVGLTLARDSHIVCQVIGRRTLYPVLQVHARTAKDAALPYALTNPVFVDVDGNGRYDAPLPREIRTRGETRNP